jgi:predicted nucleic acid-binding protein
MNWLLDTDVICQPAKRHGDIRVISWLEEEQDRCYTNAIVIAQLAYWVRTKDGQQRRSLQSWHRDFSRPGLKVFNPFKELS